jgi:RNA polymerase sigma factor (TIGR02999 family)
VSADRSSPDALMPLVYEELRRIAAGYIRRERPGQTLQATALVNEAFVRLVAGKPQPFANRTHFLAIAALSMRQILVQRARARNAAKRGGLPKQVTLDERVLMGDTPGIDILALDEALTRLGTFDAELAHIVELRYFAGLTVEETAEAVGSSPATIKRQWAMARAWLKRAMDAGQDDRADHEP